MLSSNRALSAADLNHRRLPGLLLRRHRRYEWQYLKRLELMRRLANTSRSAVGKSRIQPCDTGGVVRILNYLDGGNFDRGTMLIATCLPGARQGA
jgi:hypothetical protein